MKKQYIIKAVSFLLIVVILLSISTAILKDKWVYDTSSSYIQEGMYQLEDNTIDLAFMGNSQMIYGVSSMLLLKNYGISAYNTATGLQPLLCTYFNLKEICKTQDISTVVLDPGGLYEVVDDAKYRYVFDSSPMSLNKLQFLIEYCKTKQASEIWTYIFPIMTYHSRWNELKKVDFKYKKMNVDIFRGNRLHEDTFHPVYYEEVIVDNDEDLPEKEMLEEHLYYFRKIVDYCKENDINLVLIKTPKSYWDKPSMEGIQKLADEYGLDYLDFNSEKLFREVGFNVDADFKDPDHLNVRGTEKLTNYLGEYLTEKYTFEDARKSEKYDHKSMEAFICDYNNKYVTTAEDLSDLLDCINKEQYELFVQKSGIFSGNWPEEIHDKLRMLGIEQDFSLISDKNYIAHLSDGKVLYKDISIDPLQYKGKTEKAVSYVLQSNVMNTEMVPMCTFQDNELTFTMNGLNIVVFDKVNQKVVRYFTIAEDSASNDIILR